MRLRVAVRECDGFGRSKHDELTPHIILKVDGDIVEVEPRKQDHQFTSDDHSILYNPRPQFIECEVYNDSTLQEHLGTGQVYIRGILPNLATGGNIVIHPSADDKRKEIAGCVLVLMKLEMPEDEEEDWRESVKAVYTSDELGFGMEPPTLYRYPPPEDFLLNNGNGARRGRGLERGGSSSVFCDPGWPYSQSSSSHRESSLTPPAKRRAAAPIHGSHTGSCRPSMFPA